MLLACEQSSRTSRRPRAGTALKYQSAANASRSRRITASDSGAAADEACVTHRQFRKSRERHLQAPSSCAYSAWTSHWSARAASAAIASLSMPRQCSPFRPAGLRGPWPRPSACRQGCCAWPAVVRRRSLEIGDVLEVINERRRRRGREMMHEPRAPTVPRAPERALLWEDRTDRRASRKRPIWS
jgi:hypothetical protein